MRRNLRAVALVLRLSWSTDPLRSLAVLIEPLGSMARPASAVLLAIVINGVIADDSQRIIVGVLGLGVAQAFSSASQQLGLRIRLTLAEKVGFAFDRAVVGAVAALPDLHHVHDQELQNKLHLIKENHGHLAGSLNMLINTGSAIATSLGILAVLAWINPTFLLLAAFALPALPVAKRQRRLEADAERDSAPAARIADKLRDLAADGDVNADIRLTQSQAFIRAAQDDAWEISRQPHRSARRAITRANVARDLLFGLGYGLTVATLLWLAVRGYISAGQAAAGIVVGRLAQSHVLAPIAAINFFARILRTAGAAVDVIAYASQAGPPTGRCPSRCPLPIELRNVSFTYPGAATPALRNINLSIRPGEVLALVGHNGAGKTTLVNLLLGLYEPSAGEIRFGRDGLPVHARTTATFQDAARFELTLQRCVGIGHVPTIDDPGTTREALARAGAARLETQLPRGLDTQLGASWEDSVDLSGGQWQMTAIARSHARPSLLAIYDEPTANLDPHAEQDVLDALVAAMTEARRGGAAVVLVSHRLSTTRIADMIIRLEHGEICEEGIHQALMSAGGEYAKLYTLQRDHIVNEPVADRD